MRTFYVVFDKNLGMRLLQTEANSYLERVGAVVSNKELENKVLEKVTVGDVLYSPEHGFNFEIVVIK